MQYQTYNHLRSVALRLGDYKPDMAHIIIIIIITVN